MEASIGQNEIVALSIGLSIVVFSAFYTLTFGFYTNTSSFANNGTFFVKKWAFILAVLALNAVGCFLVYQFQDLQVILYVILALKSKDLLSSLIFVFVMIYKHLFTDLSIPKRAVTDEIRRIVAFVPVYKESMDQLKRTVDSVLSSTVLPHYILTCIISDGKNDYKNIMDHIISSEEVCYKNWLGVLSYIKVFYGTRGDRHIVLLSKTENSGKKDSILLAHSIFNTTSPNTLNSSVENIKTNVLKTLLSTFGVDRFDFVFATDADTVIDTNAISCLMDSIEKRDAIASCGIVNADHSEGSWFWNSLQNYQYLYGQYTRRSVEDICNQVLCLPGCISMMRLHANGDQILKMYSEIPDKHTFVLSNVQYVGTDRRLTGSMVYTDKNSKIVMDLRCHAYTLPPQNVSDFTAQRRRWCQNTYFNTMINVIAPNVKPLLRLFCLIDVLRQSLVYFRLFNTMFFLYLLITQFNPDKVLGLVPYIVILVYPTVFFFIYSIFNQHLRKQWFTLALTFVINKIFVTLSSISIFSVMLFNIGYDSWAKPEVLQQV